MNRFVYLYVCLIQLNKLFVLEHYNFFVEKKNCKNLGIGFIFS